LKLKPLILLLSFVNISQAQNIELRITGLDTIQSQIIDSIDYIKIHPNLKSVLNTLNQTTQLLSKKGFPDTKILSQNKLNDSLYCSKLSLGERIKYTYIYIGKNSLFSMFEENKSDTIKIPFQQTENYLNQKVIDAEKQGYVLSKINLKNIDRKDSVIYAELNFETEKKRSINSIIINYTNSNQKEIFPKGHLKQLNRKYLNKIITRQTVQRLHADLNDYDFVSQTKYPEILFTNDSTKIFTYLEKRKANTFDGYIGFTNSDSKKITLNGYLDITLQNTLRAGEQFSLYWKNNGNQQTTFDTKLEIPYVFKTPLGIKAQLNIFKQDSTFQNSKTEIDLGYYINYNTKVFAGYQTTESSNIQNINSTFLSDFKNSYFISSFLYRKSDYNNLLMPLKAVAELSVGTGKRKLSKQPEENPNQNQTYFTIDLSYNFEVNSKSFFHLSSKNYYLKSDTYLTNELIRFGGINSVRGFLENSLQANFIGSLLTEYRYLVSRNLYIHSITDYLIYQDQTRKNNPEKTEKLVGIGGGISILTTNGLLKITLANGDNKLGNLQLYNTMVNICYNVKF
jgi:hypothetical protein